ncbi:ABC transporter ATP-binding protein [Candidatus Saccharibacteria bacterium]|nr:ABC transporter ATP-binding protein [Candidatus Saccharibacteria bacterium]
MLRLFKYLKPYILQVIILLASTALQVYCTLRLPALMADIINDGIVPSNMDFIWRTGLLMLGLAVLSAVGALVSNLFAARIGANFSKDLRHEIFKKVISLDLADTKNFSTASLITRTTNDINQVQQAITMILSMLIRAPMFCIFALVMAFETAPDMTWIIAVSAGAILILVFTIMALVVPKFKIFQKLLDKITLLTRENLTGLRVIRAFNKEKYEKKKFEKTNNEMTRTILFVEKILNLQNPLINIVFNGTTLLCSWVGISLLEKDIAYLGNMAAFAQYVGQVMISFLLLSMLFIMLPRANVSAGRINEVLGTKPKIHWKKQTAGNIDRVPSIEFKDVDFSYAKAEEKVLSNISFKAEAGQTTAIIGSTGSGKSTLINLIPRFFEATEGQITINGLDIKDYSREDLTKLIGFVPQRGILFSGSIAENIAFGAPHANKDDIKNAAKIAQAADFIEKLPNKYDYQIAQGGTNVSGGQKQRLSIARAICKNPSIFVFDDSFSALDMKTDANLRQALAKITKSAVTIIVAQRISTIKNAEQIIVLDQGKVVGKGNHHSLLKSCPVYQEIVKSQISEAEFKKEMKEAEHA